VALAQKLGIPPGKLDVDLLQRKLAENGVMLCFFNDFDMATSEDWVPAVQYLGTKGFFTDYNARPNDVLTRRTAGRWVEIASLLPAGGGPHAKGERRTPGVRRTKDARPPSDVSNKDEGRGVTFRELEAMLGRKLSDSGRLEGESQLSRGEACLLLYRSMNTLSAEEVS
jgi:hypothetical protein